MNRKLQPLNIAISMYEKAESQNLIGFDRLSDYDKTRRICNGIGAEWMPEWSRNLVSNLAPAIVPTSWIHDLDYENGGSIWDRWKVDWIFLRNAIRGSIVDYKWNTIQRYHSICQAFRLWFALRMFGQLAFNWHK